MSDDDEDGNGEGSLTADEVDSMATARARRQGRTGGIVPAKARVAGVGVQIGGAVQRTTAPCRQCRTPVEITDTGFEAFKSACHLMVARGEPPLDPRCVYLCTNCRRAEQSTAAKHHREICDRMAAQMRKLLAGCSPSEERAALKYLEEHGNETRPTLEKMLEEIHKNREKARGGKVKPGDF